MPCGLAVITLAQKEARPQPIWWGEQPSLSLQRFISPSPSRLCPPEETSEAQHCTEKENKTKQEFKKNAPVTAEMEKHNRFKGKVRNQTASRG